MTDLYDCERAEASLSAAPTVSSEQGRNIAGEPDLPDQSGSVESGATPSDTPALPYLGSQIPAVAQPSQRGTWLVSGLVALALAIFVAVAVSLKPEVRRVVGRQHPLATLVALVVSLKRSSSA